MYWWVDGIDDVCGFNIIVLVIIFGILVIFRKGWWIVKNVGERLELML